MLHAVWRVLSRGTVGKAALAALAGSVALWPARVLANPPRPSWKPGPPWAPVAPHSSEVHQISNLFWVMLGSPASFSSVSAAR